VPKRAKASSAQGQDSLHEDVGLEAAFRRIANLLALNLVKGESETEKVLTLTAVGYSTNEIARLLGKQPTTVSVILYRAKQDGRRRAKAQ